MTSTSASLSSLDLRQIYTSYIAAIQPSTTDTPPSVDQLDAYVAHNVVHNDIPLGLSGYKALIQANILTPRSAITVTKLLVDAEQRCVGAQLIFRVPATVTAFLGFTLRPRTAGEVLEVLENVFYQFDTTGRIERVWSVVDLDPVRAFVLQGS